MMISSMPPSANGRVEVIRRPPQGMHFPDKPVLRVAAYARVSTLKENQADSFDTQMKYYTEYINKNTGWVFANVYADNGFSGVSAENRPGFMAMMAAAERGEMDILLVRSISRFSRNVQEAQVFCRRLRVLGVEVRFEREGISSADPSAEMAFNLLAACAQEESRSISERTKWGVHKMQAQGILHIGDKALGYAEVGGVLTPTDEAWVIRLIFEAYADGEGTSAIADRLRESGFVRRKTGRPLTRAHVRYILKNPIYVGDRLLQRQPPRHYMTHRPDRTQPYDSYRVTAAHPGIIPRPLWDRVQRRLAWEEALSKMGVQRRRGCHFLYGRVFCGQCGRPMKRKAAGSGRLRPALWTCTGRRTGQKGGGCGITWPEERLMRGVGEWLGCAADEVEGHVGEIGRIVLHGEALKGVKATEQEVN